MTNKFTQRIDVALVNPGRGAIYPPLNLGFIASYLGKHGVSVAIIDEQVGQNVKEELNRLNPRIVGITATTAVAPDAYRIADYVKENSDALTVMGGSHASAMSDEALQHVDVVIKGEGERAILDIVKNGVKSRIISGPIIENIDEVPMPARHLMDMKFYLCQKEEISGKYVTGLGTLITSRGCPYRCIFCYNSWRDTPVRYNSAERVLEELKHLVEVYDVKNFLFLDDCLTMNRKRLIAICELMIKNKLSEIPWRCSARVDSVDLEVLRIMKKAGCAKIQFGFESGSQKILNVLNKKTTVEQNRNAIKLCKKTGIEASGTFMIGNPTETIQDIEATERFIEENDVDSAGICITTPFPGTKLWEWAHELGLMPEKIDYSKFTLDFGSLWVSDKIPSDVLNIIYAKLKLKCALKNYGKLGYLNRLIKHPSAIFKFKYIKPLMRWLYYRFLK